MKDSQEGQPTSLCYFSKIGQVQNLYARLCLDLAYVYSSQSSCVLVGQTAPFSATMKNFSKLLTTFVDSYKPRFSYMASMHGQCAVT